MPRSLAENYAEAAGARPGANPAHVNRANGVVILGVGNVLSSDDGIGVRVAQELARRPDLPAGVRVVDGGTAGFRLLPLLETAQRLILVDALDVGAPPGTVLEIEPQALEGPALHASLHEAGPLELLACVEALTGRRLPAVVVGIQPGSVSPWNDCLTAPVAAALPEAVARVLAVLHRWALEAATAPPRSAGRGKRLQPAPTPAGR
ncbi:MAG: HyaD/HybD family hydrogenase maturation endopeptidase [Chloroflexota bacterium]|nr:HyaD/HybD family hydrogenase maturation endopeptidase [Chloroflexota bacterium]